MQPVISMQRPVDTGGAPGTAASRWRASRPARCRKAASRCSPTTPRTWSGSRAGSTHPNGAFGLAGLTIAVADVDEAAARFARFTGRTAEASPAGRTIRLDRGRLDLVSADAFAACSLPECPIPSLPFAGLCEITVKSLPALEALLGNAGLRTRRAGETLIAPFPVELGVGAWRFSE